ncbi:MAG: UDP-N-acetylglucosamine 1-carboxyvinyltransferase [Cytophagaceae bacterium]|nr:UDP-N-acetylglucosamine 1-carboxyvinyltransferase [Cytophagaceae bacterium]MBL0302906.1 UDP-N-acetylglucosamine 1-carboxyvinyltransferase [Cytophagaceae bacterium]MBL0325736.1 UDP-N-acetylglucosamine 1-carboxyvinyltransferase [Cytophagaceae bacterium]
MASFKINGGRKLKGELVPQGAKNEALQILCAVLLTKEPVIIHNIPNIRDVNKLMELLEDMGVKRSKLAEGTYRFKADEVNYEYFESAEYKAKASELRGSVMLLGPMLGRFGKGTAPKPGGDKIGRRPLDTHFVGFQKLGAEFSYDADDSFYQINGANMKGSYIWMEEISVTGTANVLMAAVLTKGETTIYNAACEPYLQQLCKMLNAMGAKIEGVGSNLLTITGVDELGGCEHTMLPDMIEIGSFIGLAAMTQSEITIKNCHIKELGIIPDTFKKLGIEMEFRGDDIFIPEQSNYKINTLIDGSILTIYDAPWPGFTPDLISIVLVTAIQAKGTVLIHQKMFESRLFFTDKLIDMGAQIILCDPHRATVIGINREYNLRGIRMSSPDIRAGVALLIAALSANGTSIIDHIEQIDRGYQNIDGRLNAIGADIVRI